MLMDALTARRNQPLLTPYGRRTETRVGLPATRMKPGLDFLSMQHWNMSGLSAAVGSRPGGPSDILSRPAADITVGRTTRLGREAGRREWAPTRKEVMARHRMIRRLVWLDTEGQFQRFARSVPWTAGDTLQDQIRGLQRRSPLLQWHVNHNVLPPIPMNTPQLSRSQAGAKRSGKELTVEDGHRKCMELKQAISEIIPVFFSLVFEATRREP